MAAAISIQGLTKKYVDVWQKQEVVAVNNLNLEVEEGEIFGFLGRNGDGEPGAQTLWLGLQRLDDIRAAWAIFSRRAPPTVSSNRDYG